jgi:hypothetical protein
MLSYYYGFIYAYIIRKPERWFGGFLMLAERFGQGNAENTKGRPGYPITLLKVARL